MVIICCPNLSSDGVLGISLRTIRNSFPPVIPYDDGSLIWQSELVSQTFLFGKSSIAHTDKEKSMEKVNVR
jgi:hypothetical protein